MRASSSSADCARPKARSSGATTPLSICMKSVSSSWARSPMGMRPAMRAPPLSVCSGRLSAVNPSTLPRFSFHCASALCEASMSSTASSVKMLAMSGSKSVSTSSATSAAGAGAWLTTGFSAAGKGADGAATAGATLAGGTGGGAAASSAARAAAMMRPSSCSVAASRRASNELCDWKKPVDSSRCEATAPMAVMQSASRPRSGASRPTPLSNDLRTQCSSGAVRRMPWRASAMRELPDSVWQAR